MTPTDSQKRHRSKERVSLCTSCAGALQFLSRQGRQAILWRARHYSPGRREVSGGRPYHCWWDSSGLGGLSRWKLNFWGEAIGRQTASQYEEEINIPQGSGCTQQEVGSLPPEHSRKARKPQKGCHRAYLCIWRGEMIRGHQILVPNWDSDWGWHHRVEKVIESELQLLSLLPMKSYSTYLTSLGFNFFCEVGILIVVML